MTALRGGRALLFALAVVACAEESGDERTAAASEIDICALVSRDEAAATLGSTVRDGHATVANFTQFTCRWEAEDGFGQISVEVRAGDRQRFTEFYEFGGPAQPVAGLGERAEWDDTQGRKASRCSRRTTSSACSR
jgi:hypothetical protein